MTKVDRLRRRRWQLNLAEGAEIGRQSRIHFANALRTTRSTQAFAKTLGLMGSTRKLELPALLLFR